VRQDEQREQFRTQLDEQSRRARALRDAHTAIQLSWNPPEGGWSIGQVLEHLCIANDSYLAQAEGPVDHAKREPARARTATWRPTVMGNFLVRSFNSTRRLPAPKIYRPGAAAREAVIDAFLARQEAIGVLLERAVDVVWQDSKMKSPVTSLIRLNLGDGFAIMLTHADRHLRQIERVERHVDFPR